MFCCCERIVSVVVGATRLPVQLASEDALGRAAFQGDCTTPLSDWTCEATDTQVAAAGAPLQRPPGVRSAVGPAGCAGASILVSGAWCRASAAVGTPPPKPVARRARHTHPWPAVVSLVFLILYLSFWAHYLLRALRDHAGLPYCRYR